MPEGVGGCPLVGELPVEVGDVLKGGAARRPAKRMPSASSCFSIMFLLVERGAYRLKANARSRVYSSRTTTAMEPGTCPPLMAMVWPVIQEPAFEAR